VDMTTEGLEGEAGDRKQKAGRRQEEADAGAEAETAAGETATDEDTREHTLDVPIPQADTHIDASTFIIGGPCGTRASSQPAAAKPACT
jgi:hypothetical protein